MSEFSELRHDIGKVYNAVNGTRDDVAKMDTRLAVIEATAVKDVADLKRRADEHEKWHLKQKEKMCSRAWDLLIRVVPPAILLFAATLIAWGKMKLGWESK